MATGFDDDQAYQRAKAHIDAVRRFYEHLGAYVVVNLALFLLNLVLSPHNLWFQWVLLGWGILLILEALNAFFFSDRFRQRWEERKLREFMERDRTPQ